MGDVRDEGNKYEALSREEFRNMLRMMERGRKTRLDWMLFNEGVLVEMCKRN